VSGWFTTCAVCGQEATGHTFFGRRRVCTSEDGPSCLEAARDGAPFIDEPYVPPSPHRRDGAYEAVERLFKLHGFSQPRGLQGPLNNT
jgi:hypothetical protein